MAAIIVIGIALAAVHVADSAASNWGAVYLNDALGSTESLAARTVVDRVVVVVLAPAFRVRVRG